MKQSMMLIPTLREVPAEAEAASHQLLLRSGFIRQVAAGIYTYLPLGWRVMEKIKRIIRQEMNAIGAHELHMPAMQPTELWKLSGRYEVYEAELIRFEDRHKREFALGPTHEEVITALIGEEVSSYRELPLVLYQIQTKYRDESRPRYGLLRGREFLMKDAYSFHMDQEGLDHTFTSMYHAYHSIFKRCGLQFRAVEADSGAIGGDGETFEFMALAEIGEDTIVSCDQCGYAANMERAESREGKGVYGQVKEGDHCLKCEGSLTIIRGIELGHIFKLGTKYTEAMQINLLTNEGTQQHPIMGCYGIGISRLLAAIIEQNHDQQGIVWPAHVAPADVHLITVSMQDQVQLDLSEQLYRQLTESGVEVLWDNRMERPGVKFNDADLIGIPIRLIVGKQAEQGRIEYRERLSQDTILMTLDEIVERVTNNYSV
ncbi:proline--tRNA ligase [Paenibacillus albiflavus]|uniref:Proline--tRNA ligase n=1 Tax=Paenibacillus albiflavus TaxID=2545760 RepID=A0A4R4EL66_9BACL|nr:proline--tRNA ligase [Paenibacillus albiflavus]TCZ80080.1 proline--tRNA ligase [Paenibacillus albiflavus]